MARAMLEELHDPYSWDGWTAGMVRTASVRFAQAGQSTLGELLELARADLENERDRSREEVKTLEARVKELRRRAKEQAEYERGLHLLPKDIALEKLLRYEAHAGRQLLQALHTLERLQAGRAGQPVSPPAALDVIVDGAERLPLPAPGNEIAGGNWFRLAVFRRMIPRRISAPLPQHLNAATASGTMFSANMLVARPAARRNKMQMI